MFTQIPKARILHQYTVDLIRDKVLTHISESSAQGRFQCFISESQFMICGKELREKDYLVEYHMLHGFLIKWDN